jgi:hypothetical protein
LSLSCHQLSLSLTCAVRHDGAMQIIDKIATIPAAETVPPLAVTFPHARHISGLGLTTLWKLAREHRIETVRIGRRTLITYRSLERLLLPFEPSNGLEPRRRGRPRKVAIPINPDAVAKL